MRRKITFLLGVIILLSQLSSFVLAKATPISKDVKIAIKKYKAGNYTGCLQDCEDIISKKPSALAYYYLAMSYAQAGKKTEAIENYSKVINMNPNKLLSDYATLGKTCIENPEGCHPEDQDQTSEELDKFIKTDYTMLSDSVKKGIQQRRLNDIKNEINQGKELDDYNFQKINENDNIKIAQKPSEQEVKDALKVLNEAGINPYNSYNAQSMITAPENNTELMQLQALLGKNTTQSNQNNNNSMLDSLPFVLSQNKDGKSNYSPQMVQTIIMNSMMNNLDYNIDTSKE